MLFCRGVTSALAHPLRRRRPAGGVPLGTASPVAQRRSAAGSVAGSSVCDDVRPVSRDVALERWGATATLTDKALDFAHKVRPFGHSRSAELYGEVAWDAHERMDFGVEWSMPATWTAAQRAKANFLSLQCAPPRPDVGASGPVSDNGPTVHGMSLTAFMYHRPVENADSDALMATFLRQFNRSVGNSLVVLGSTDEAQKGRLNRASRERCVALQEEGGGTCAELKFTAPQCPSIPARGLCRAFFAPNLRAHYVAVFAVPCDEFDAVEDLVTYGVSSVQPAAKTAVS